MKNLFLTFLLLLSFAASAQAGYENPEEVESDDPAPEAPIGDYIFILIACGLGYAAYIIKNKNE